MTVAQTAKRIGISPSKVYALVSQRRIAHYRVGGKILFAEADIEAFLQSCRVGVGTLAVPQSHARPRLKHLHLS